MSARARFASLTAIALVVPLLVWLAPAAGAAVGDVELASPNGRDVWPGKKPSDLNVYNGQTAQDATATFRNKRGKVVRTMAVPPTCFFDACTLAESSDGHEVRWNGRNNRGRFVKPGRYTGRIRMINRNGQAHSVSLGNLWVNRLVTRTRENFVEVALRDPTLAALSTIGRCSSVTGPTPNRPWQLRLLSMNRCQSSAGTDDWAFRANRLELWQDDHASRVMSVRIGATGSPVHAGDMASIVVDSSAGRAARPVWRRVAVLDTAGTHLGKAFIPPRGSMNGPSYHLFIQARVVNGNRWRINQFKAIWTYRAFTR